ncbi:MAG: MFS transporter [Anaerolineae bacterium]|nr:MFS transporter [Anaerolineae bacterium]
MRPRTTEDRNLLLLYGDIALQGVVAGGAAAYLSVFIVRLGASPLLVGLLTSLPSLMVALLSLPAGRYVEGQRRLVPVVVKSRVLFRISYLLIALVPWVLPGLAAVAIVIIWALASAVSAVATVAFTAAMAEAVPTHRRAAVISLRYAIHAVVAAATLPVTGRILDSMPFPLGYQVVFLISFVAAMLSVWAYSKISLPDQRVAVQLPIRTRAWQRLLAAPHSWAAHSRFMGYLASSAVFRIGLHLPAALFSIFWVNYLGLPDGSIALLSMVMNVSAVLGYFYWGRLAKRRGHGPVLVASGLGLATYPLLTAVSHSLPPILVAAAAGGWFSAGINLAFFNVLLAVAPEERRSSFLAVDSVVTHSIAFAGPLVGSLLTGLLGIREALLLSAAFRLAGGALFILKRVRD